MCQICPFGEGIEQRLSLSLASILLQWLLWFTMTTPSYVMGKSLALGPRFLY